MVEQRKRCRYGDLLRGGRIMTQILVGVRDFLFSKSVQPGPGIHPASAERKMATMQHKTFCVREFIKTEPQLTLLHGCALGEHSSGGIGKLRTSSFKRYVDHSHTMYSSGNIDVRN